MDYDRTTVKFNVLFLGDNVKLQDIFTRLEKLKIYIKEKSDTYGFKLFHNDEEIDGSESESLFNEYIEYIRSNIVQEDGEYFIESAGPYATSDWPDLE